MKELRFGDKIKGEIEETELIVRAYEELREYLAGNRRRFDIRLAPEGTFFQKAVWNELSSIPYGETHSYSAIANSIGKPAAARAVGQACNKNPIAVIIPCHRAVGKNGELTGFAGGLDNKAMLLNIEKNAPRTFKYGERELQFLKSRDKKLAELIEKIGFPEYEIMPDLFAALTANIMGQQISMKAAETVWRRTKEKFGEVTPQKILSVSAEELQSVGISMRKVSYIREAAEMVLSGKLDIDSLKSLNDDEVCEKLIKLRGIGRWTAEMLMIFSMERQNILSYDDLGIRRGIMKLYGLEKLDKTEFEKYRALFSPYCTIASFYLWASNDLKEGK